MRKLIAAMNMTVDGYCDHTLGNPDDQIHDHYTNLINQAGVLLYGRVTYQLMEYWKTVLNEPVTDQSAYDFAVAIDKTPKIVFSRTITELNWHSASLAKEEPHELAAKLKQQDGADVYVCSPGLIVALTRAKLIDEYQLCIHPLIATRGLPLFANLQDQVALELADTKRFNNGAIILYYHASTGKS